MNLQSNIKKPKFELGEVVGIIIEPSERERRIFIASIGGIRAKGLSIRYEIGNIYVDIDEEKIMKLEDIQKGKGMDEVIRLQQEEKNQLEWEHMQQREEIKNYLEDFFK